MYFCLPNKHTVMANRDINRLKVILANKKYTGIIRQKSGLYKIEHLQDIQKGKFVEVKTFTLDYTLGIAFIEYMIIYYSV